MRLLAHAIEGKVHEVGDFDGSLIAIVTLDGRRAIRIPVTEEEARALGSRLYQTVRFRLAVDEPAPAPTATKE